MSHTSRHFVEKPKTIEARKFDGDTSELMEVVSWLQENGYVLYDTFTPAPARGVSIDPSTGFLTVVTEGDMAIIRKGDWIFKDVTGAFRQCSAAIFENTYEEIDVPEPPPVEEPSEEIPPTEEDPVTGGGDIPVDPPETPEVPVDPETDPESYEEGSQPEPTEPMSYDDFLAQQNPDPEPEEEPSE